VEETEVFLKNKIKQEHGTAFKKKASELLHSCDSTNSHRKTETLATHWETETHPKQKFL